MLLSVRLFHTSSSTMVHFRAIVTIEHETPYQKLSPLVRVAVHPPELLEMAKQPLKLPLVGSIVASSCDTFFANEKCQYVCRILAYD